MKECAVIFRGALLAAGLLCCLSPVFGQFNHSVRIDKRSGLTDTRVRAIDKDRYGFVWIGTHNGLNRFDGSQFMQFLNRPGDPTSLMDNEIFAIAMDSQRIWVGNQYGVSALDLLDFSIRNIQFNCDSILPIPDPQHAVRPVANALYLDGDYLWATTRECGLIRYDIPNNTIRHFSFASHWNEYPNMVSADALDLIMGFCPDRVQDSIFWIGTASGLIRFNKLSFTHTLFYNKVDDLLYQDAINTFRRVIHQDDGRIYYLTWSYGVNIYDPETNTFYPLPIEDTDNEILRHAVSDIRRHDPYSIWMRTSDGLYLYNTALHRVTGFYPPENPEDQFSPVYFEDESHRRWFSADDGVRIYDPLLEQFLVFSYEELNVPEWYGFARKVIAHPDGIYLTILGQGVDGLYHYSHKGNRWFKTQIPGFSAASGKAFNGIDFEANDTFGWVFSSPENIFMFDPEQFTVREINLNIDLPRRKYVDLAWDHDGNLWIGTRHEGLLRWNPTTGVTTQFLDEIYGANETGQAPAAVGLFVDSGNHVWFTTSAGHSVYDPASGTFYNFNTKTDIEKTLADIANFIETPTGTIRAITRHGVVAKGSVVHPDNGIQAEFSIFEKSQLAPSYVEGIAPGPGGEMFALNETALIRIDTNNAVTYFGFEYAEFLTDFYSFDHLFEASFVIGLRNQFSVVYIDGLRRNKERPIPYLTQVSVNEIPLSGNFVQQGPKLDLKYNENFVSFSFSAISYTLPEGNKFRYRLTGFDPEWIDAGERRFANYTNIPSGDYQFELQVANNEGVWNTDIYTTPVAIASPWWATWWFRILAFCAVVSIGVLAYRYRVAQIHREATLKAEFDRKIGDVELSALKAQMNPHFIFNCLNSIENYILKNESLKAAEYINDFARLIRLILQNSRSQYIPLKDEIEALDLYLQMESLRFDNKFEYQINISPDVELSETDIPPMMIQPFVENAIWHGLIPKHAPGKLQIDISRHNGELRCIIQDNGIGRDKSKEVNASMYKRGKKSMGMLITKNRIDVFNELYQTNATVQIHDLRDDEGNSLGTKVDLNIPVE